MPLQIICLNFRDRAAHDNFCIIAQQVQIGGGAGDRKKSRMFEADPPLRQNEQIILKKTTLYFLDDKNRGIALLFYQWDCAY